MTRRLAVTALASYVAGYALGTLVCHWAWITTSHETRYRLRSYR